MTQCRIACGADKPQLAANWQDAFGDGTAYIDFVFDRFAGLAHTYVSEQDGAVVASLCAVPVTLGRYQGIYLYGVNTKKEYRSKGIMDVLLRYVHETEKQNGAAFSVLIPASESLFGYYEKYGYQTVFYRHILRRPIRNNIWAQADFDTITAPRLNMLRHRFLEHEIVEFEPSAHAAMMQDLYTGGATTVETEGGYGIFFEMDGTLAFKEFLACDNLAANRLLEAARQHTGCENAALFLPRYSEVYLGEGGEESPYGQLCWLNGEKKLIEPYMSLMCD